jgi:hypothetical protein
MRQHESALLAASQTSYRAGIDLDARAQEFIELPIELTTRKSSLLALKTREVCRDCNNGWMSGLETSARPLIRQVADAAQTGRLISLPPDEARTLAIWCQKTAVTYELKSDRRRVVTTAMGQQLATGTPLRAGMVWLARHPRDYDLSIALVHIDVSPAPIARPGDQVRQIALVSITYHWATFLVFITDKPGQRPPPLPLDRWSLLWPARSPAEFPPPATLTGTELTTIMTEHSHWLPPVQATTIRRSAVPPQTRHHS